MKLIYTIFKKEVLVTLRDKRSLFTSMVLPAFLIPCIILGVVKFQSYLNEKEHAKKIKVALIGGDEIMYKSIADCTITLVAIKDVLSGRTAIQEEKLDAILELEKDYFSKQETFQTGTIKLHFKSTNFSIKSRLQEKIEILKTNAIQKRIALLRVKEEALVPIKVQEIDVATTKEQIGIVVGGFVPYIFILFSFMGCIYPAIDLITGEKEKNTLETLLTVPVSTFKILLGKVMTIALFGLISAVMAILGIIIMINLSAALPVVIIDTIRDIVGLKFVFMLFLMLLPLTFFFAGFLSMLVINAKSFKEAQSLVTPLTFVVIIPAVLALMPGMTLNWQTAFIPILNVALATKQIISGSINIAQYWTIVFSLFLMAFLAILLSYKQFSKEKMILN